MSFIGIPIGFYGYIFPGNINLMVVELYGSKKFKFLFFIMILILLFESFYCFFSLYFLESIKANHSFYHVLEIASYVMIFFMGLWMVRDKRENSNPTHNNIVYRGVLSIIIHPQQIPYWVVFGVVLAKITPLMSDVKSLLIFALFNAVGTFLAMLTYMFFGLKLFTFLRLNVWKVNRIIGVVYILLSLFNLFDKLI